MTDVFVTFAPSDAELALRLAKGLERAGLSVTRGPLQYAPDWAVRTYDAIDASSAVIALWSRDAIAREWVGSEAGIAAHFGQLVSVRVDPALARDQIPSQYREPDGSVLDLFEGDVAPEGWAQVNLETLDRAIAPVAGKVRTLKARGPVAAPIEEAGALSPVSEILTRHAAGFAMARTDGVERTAKTLPELAVSRRESAFRGAYEALEMVDFPPDVRAGLVDLAGEQTTERGLARLYAEALSRSDREFWGNLGRVALPLSPSLALASLQRSGASGGVIQELLDPRDSRDLHAERFGRGRARAARGGVVMWPMAAVALGVAALVGMPQISRLIGTPTPTPEAKTRTAESKPASVSQQTKTEERVAPKPVIVAIPPQPPKADRIQLADARAPLQVAVPSTAARVAAADRVITANGYAPAPKQAAKPAVVAAPLPVVVAQNEVTPPPVVKPTQSAQPPVKVAEVSPKPFAKPEIPGATPKPAPAATQLASASPSKPTSLAPTVAKPLPAPVQTAAATAPQAASAAQPVTVVAAPLQTLQAGVDTSVSQALLRGDTAPTQMSVSARLRFCRLAPGPAEYTVEVLPSEDLASVAERVALGDPEGFKLIAERNADCLQNRRLQIAENRTLAGTDLLFPGDRLVIPAAPLLERASNQVTPTL